MMPFQNDNLVNPLYNLPVAAYTCDAEGYLTSFNSAAENLWGRKPEIGSDLWSGSWKTSKPNGEFMPSDELPLAKAIRNGLAINGEQIIIHRPDGSTAAVHAYPAAIFDQAGQLTGAIDILIDIPVQVKNDEGPLSAELKTLYEKIRRLEAREHEFIGLASHELKTPITSLGCYLQVAHRALSNDDPNKIFISKALQQMDKLCRLVNDLLYASREDGQLLLSFARFDLIELTNELVEVMRFTSPSHRIEFSTSVAQLFVVADKTRIEQVILNIVANAVKYSPGSDRVQVSVSATGDKAIVAIQDFGIGINKEQQAYIFTKFYRVQEPRSTISGFGIGLYICDQIIIQHQGKLWVESRPEKGSTFCFEIPVNR